MYSGSWAGSTSDGTDSATVAGSSPSKSYHAGQGIAKSGFWTRLANSL